MAVESDRPLDVSSYEVFQGVTLSFINAHSSSFVKNGDSGDFLQILHVREGRAEWEEEGSFCFLSPGDIAIRGCNDDSLLLDFPLEHFHGLSILFDLDKAPKCFSCILEDVRVKPLEIRRRFSPDSRSFIARSDEHITHLFSELYSMDEEYRIPYFKVKVLELLIFLMAFRRDREDDRRIPRAQVDNAKAIASYLSSHLSERTTLSELSRLFASSPTSIKSSFKKVYGISVYSFAKKVKMEEVARRLRETDLTITDIASSFGYENSSKFAAAFQSVIGRSPSEYRKVLSDPNDVSLE